MRFLVLLAVAVWAHVCCANDMFLTYEEMRGQKSRTLEIGNSGVNPTPSAFLLISEEKGLRIKPLKFILPEGLLDGKNVVNLEEQNLSKTALQQKTILTWEPIVKGHGSHKVLTRPTVRLENITDQSFDNIYFEGLESLTLAANPACSELIEKIQIGSLSGKPIGLHGNMDVTHAEFFFCPAESESRLFEELLKRVTNPRNSFLIVGASQIIFTFKS